MNLAFSALLIIMLLLPGFIFHTVYSRGYWTSFSIDSTQFFADRLAHIIVFAIPLHLIWAYLLSTLFGRSLDLGPIMHLLLNTYGQDNQFFESTIQSVTCCPSEIALYLFSLYVFAAIVGFSTHKTVRHFKLDHKTNIFRFNNEWHYLLRGETLELHDYPGEPIHNIDGVYLSAVVQHGDADYLYRGLVVHFTYAPGGQLDKVVLQEAHRRKLSDDRPPGQVRDPLDHGTREGSRYYRIEGDFFILKYADMQTVNLEYFTLDEDDLAIQEEE